MKRSQEVTAIIIFIAAGIIMISVFITHLLGGFDNKPCEKPQSDIIIKYQQDSTANARHYDRIERLVKAGASLEEAQATVDSLEAQSSRKP